MNKILVTGCFAFLAIAIIDCSIVTRNGDSDLDLQVVHQNDLIADEVKDKDTPQKRNDDKVKKSKHKCNEMMSKCPICNTLEPEGRLKIISLL